MIKDRNDVELKPGIPVLFTDYCSGPRVGRVYKYTGASMVIHSKNGGLCYYYVKLHAQRYVTATKANNWHGQGGYQWVRIEDTNRAIAISEEKYKELGKLLQKT
jgi:hypothetical protein